MIMNEQKLTNKQAICLKEGKDFLDDMSYLMRHPLKEYIDFEGYFNAPDGTDLQDFIRNKGKCCLKPSELEIQTAMNAGQKITDEWMKEHSEKEYLILDYCKVFGEDYVTVADLENMEIKKTPKENVIIEEP